MGDSQNALIWGWRGATPVISQRMKRLLETGERSDIQFAVGQQYGMEQFFPAHKFVLSAGSDVFDTMFYGERPQLLVPHVDEKIIKLPDILPQAFEIMLKYLYTDAIEGLDLENVLPTIYCATKYGLPVLLDFCTEYTIKNVDKSACLAVLEAAKLLDAEKVVNKCLEILDTHCSDILGSGELLGVKRETLHFLLSRDALAVKEAEVYSAAERWATKACETNRIEPTPVNRRVMLGELLFLIRFPVMDDGQLANGPVKTGLLLREELFDIYQFKHAMIKPVIPFSGIPRSSPNITFCGHHWIILDRSYHSSGILSRNNAFLDDRGRLHLRLAEHNGVWKGAGVQSVNALRPGVYDFQVEGKLDLTESSIDFVVYRQPDNKIALRTASPKRSSYNGLQMWFKTDQDARISVILSSHFGNAPSHGQETEIILHSFRLSP